MKLIKNLWGWMTGYSACRNCGARFNWKAPESILTSFGSMVEILCHNCFCKLGKVEILDMVWKELQGDADDREFDPMVIDEKHPKFLGQIKTASDYIERRKDDYNNSPGNNAKSKQNVESPLVGKEEVKG